MTVGELLDFIQLLNLDLPVMLPAAWSDENAVDEARFVEVIDIYDDDGNKYKALVIE